METRLHIDDNATENFSYFVKFSYLDLRYLAQECDDVQERAVNKGYPKASLQNLCASSTSTETLIKHLPGYLHANHTQQNVKD